MAIDIGTGIINIEIDRRQVRQEALQASRVLAGTRTELRPQINVQQLAARLRQGIQQGGGRETWRPFELAGTQAMQAVGASGVAALSVVEARGLAAAARMRAAFATVRIPPQQFGGAAGAVPRVAPGAAAGGGGRGGLGPFALGGLAGSLSGLEGDIGELATGVGAVTQSFTTMGPAAAAVAAGMVGLGIGIRRFQRFGGFQGFNAATSGSLLQALGFRSLGLQSRERFDEREQENVRNLTGATDDLAAARARAARETDKSATQEQQARGERERALEREIARRRRTIANYEERLEAARRPGAPFSGFRQGDLESGIRTQQELVQARQKELDALRQGTQQKQAETRQSRRVRQVETLRERTLKELIETNRRRIANYEPRLARARRPGALFGGIRSADLEQSIESSRRSIQEYEGELRAIQDRRKAAERAARQAERREQSERAGRQSARAQQQSERAAAAQAASDNDLNRRERRERERLRERIRLLNEKEIDAVSDQADESRRQADLLRGRTQGDRELRRQHRAQSQRYIESIRAQAVEAKRAEIFQRRQAGAIRRQLVLGRGTGLRPLERLGVAFEGLGGAISNWATGIAIAAAATYILGRAINAAARRFEEVQAAQIAAGSIAQRTLAAPTGAAVDIQQVQAGIRAGAAGGLSELTVARTAIDAIRTGSEDIFLNTETVLRDLRVVAAATGVAFEDATTRFFRGIIKREQELLDELGIVARVEAANERYARSINVAASQLTPYQQQLAFANEVYRQLAVSASQFGQDAVLSTQAATTAGNVLSAQWADFVSDFGARNQRLSQNLSAAGIGALTYLRILLRVRRQRGGPEVVQVSAVNRLEAERNRIIIERLGLVSKAAIAGALNIQQQRSLVEIQRQIADQQERIYGRGGIGAPSPAFSDRNIQQAGASQLEAQGIITNLRDARERGRISALQGPLNALLSSIEGGGRIARLSTEAYQDLTRGTAESEEAIRLLAVIYERTTEDVKELIEEYRQLDEEKKKAKKATDDERLSLNQLIAERQKAIRSGEFLREQYLELSRILPDNLRIADAARIAQGGPESVFRLPGATGFPADAAARAGIVEAFEGRFPGLDVQLTSLERFSESAANFGVTLDFMQDSLSSFVEGIALEGQNLRQALTNFLQSIARSIIRATIDRSDLGGLFTNVVTEGGIGAAGSTRYGSTYNTQVNVGIANPLQARAADASARIFGGAGG